MPRIYKGRGYPQKSPKRKGKFDPSDAQNVKHTTVGVWDLYEEIHPELAHVPGSSRLEPYLEMAKNAPYAWRMLRDIASIRACWWLLGVYLAVECVASLIPAVSLWYSAQLLNIVQSAVDKRTVDKRLLFEIAAGRLACLFLSRLLRHVRTRCVTPLNHRIKQFYAIHSFRAMARLDVPTFEDDAVQRQLEQAVAPMSHTTIAWDTVATTLRAVTTVVQLVSQLSVLASVLSGQRDGVTLALLSCAQTVFARTVAKGPLNATGVWAATTKNADYIRMEGMKKTVSAVAHRKEIVAGGLQEYFFDQFRQSVEILGDHAKGFMQAMRLTTERFSLMSFFQDPLRELPQIVFTLRAVQYPASIPVSLASLNLITQTTESFTHLLVSFYDEAGFVTEKLADVRRLYEVAHIPNRVPDGREPFPEDQMSLEQGMSVEFSNVSFRYPGSEAYALRHASFRIEKGQLCVIVGANGSGKSTILKLIARLYEPEEGEILIDDRDIKLLKLEDLRRAISVLFQDYTHFPLSIKENIGLGDPDNAMDEDKVRQAARLGGAEEFIERLPEGFETYLERPVRDYYSSLPEGTTSLFGRPVDYGRLRDAGGMQASSSKGLSGGQMQRIALSRSFMRSLVSKPGVGLLLFDEPSASLDPKAEHDLFERLRQLRGNKTMIFSSHRFGNLTRHADLILYINDSVVLEEGTHDELLKKDGEYAHIWNLQAQAFLP
ncbi:putative (ABC) transporter [Lyophyllum shimeji]|uniref:(ABC) transporter n=1 Tax=Lyophyllum shimeji TaxID=47721 RepID=A0A9P3UJ88_LYOSH|nr:putative (ABC) transporter [Lyophyllum shimeji]